MGLAGRRREGGKVAGGERGKENSLLWIPKDQSELRT